MRYLVTTNGSFDPFLTEWYDADNNFNPDLDMIVYDLELHRYTKDGTTWINLQIDHL